jgi:hypothetical protein
MQRATAAARRAIEPRGFGTLLKRKPAYVLIQFGHNDVAGKGLDRETDLPTFRANMRALCGRCPRRWREADSRDSPHPPLFRRCGRIHSDLIEHAKAISEVQLIKMSR